MDCLLFFLFKQKTAYEMDWSSDVCSSDLPQLAKLETAVFANVFGYESGDYVEVVRVLEDHPGLAGYELNVSCPNTSHGEIGRASCREREKFLMDYVISIKENNDLNTT